MRERLIKIEEKLIVLMEKSRLSDILLPFKEQPRDDAFPGDKEQKTEELGAADLFSRFTADIIKEEVIFTR